MTDHLQEAKDKLIRIETGGKIILPQPSISQAHALIAIAEQLEKMNSKERKLAYKQGQIDALDYAIKEASHD